VRSRRVRLQAGLVDSPAAVLVHFDQGEAAKPVDLLELTLDANVPLAWAAMSDRWTRFLGEAPRLLARIKKRREASKC
jgi:hypothetical protein